MRKAEGKAFPDLTDLSLGTKGVLAVALPVIALLLAMVVFYQFERQEEQAQTAVDQKFEVRSALRRLQVTMLNAETGIRGYMLTGNLDFLVPYRNAQEELPHIFKTLEATLSPEQQA